MAPVTFQYQKGAIKTGLQSLVGRRLGPDFNTKKVRLKRDDALRVIQRHDYFNTKKVRLKLEDRGFSRDVERKFQYQKGAIKTREAPPQMTIVFAISIPKRCD